MRQGSHSRNEIRKHLLPFFENLVDEVHQARQEKASMQSEATIARRGDALVAEAIGQWLLGFDRDDKHLNIDGARYYRLKDPVEKTYATSRGKVRISRHIYRPSGVHNGAIACPVELSVGMVQGQWTPGCAVSMAYTAQELPERNAAKVASKLGAMDYSASSFKRVTRALGAGWENDRDLFEDATIKAVELPDTVKRLAISVDRVSLPMAEEEGVKYRMAYCGAVTMYDGQGEPLKTLRYGRMPAEGSSCLREQMRWDVEALLERRPDLELVCLSDGAAEMCNILDEEFPDAVRYIDYYHLVEKLAAAIAAYANHRPLSKTKDEVIASWQFRLLNEDDAIDTIEKAIKRWNATDIEVGDRKPVHEALTYIENHREQMNYAAARRQGHPIGSGHVEACCKQLVACRMKRSGQRWKTRGGQAVLTLRSLATDARWEPAMKVLMPTFKRSVEEVNQAA